MKTQAPPRSFAFLLAALAAIGPFSIDTYLPAFPAMTQGLGATDLEIQQTLTTYMIPFAVMMLWHGALSDALGRRRIILVGLALFMAGSLVCAFAGNVQVLWIGRAIQGVSAGIGMVVGRAMVRDVLDGAAAQKLMAHIAVLFAIAPAIAPLVGGWVLVWFNWHGIFAFLAIFSGLMFVACALWLPETLPAEKRQSLHPGSLARAYAEVFANHAFRRLSLANAFNFNAGFIYVLCAPIFLMRHLGLSAQSFAWMFVPMVGGMMIGSFLSGRLAGKLSASRTVLLGYGVMVVGALLNLAINLALPPSLPWMLLPLPLFSLGMALSMPSIQLLALDLFPDRRGLASSCIGTIHTAMNAAVAAVIIPLLWNSTLELAAGMAAFLVLGGLAFALSRR